MHSKSSSFYESQRKLLSRVFAGLLVVLAMISMPARSSAQIYEFMELFGFVLLILAAFGRIWCSIYISGRKNQELCTEGPYSLCRNPLYLFSFIGVLGFFIALESLILCGIAASMYLVYYYGVMLSEEKRLGEIFGVAFDGYMKETPRFFPGFKRLTTVDQLLIAPRIIERGMREVVWFLLVIVCVEIIQMVHDQGHLVYFTLPF